MIHNILNIYSDFKSRSQKLQLDNVLATSLKKFLTRS